MTRAGQAPAPVAPGLRRRRVWPAAGLAGIVDRIELQCRMCGYGAVVRGDPPDCPMCHANDWALPRRPRLASSGATAAAVR